MYAKKEKIYPAFVSKHNSDCEKQVVLLMIANGEQWYYVPVKKLSALLKGIRSKHHGDFYCLNYFHSFAKENKRESNEKVCENKDFCNIIMPSEDTKILEFNQYQKLDKAPSITYADLEYLIEKIDGCENSPDNLFITKVIEHIPLGFPMSTISSFKRIENKPDAYKSKDCMKTFCDSIRQPAMDMINFKKKFQ